MPWGSTNLCRHLGRGRKAAEQRDNVQGEIHGRPRPLAGEEPVTRIMDDPLIHPAIGGNTVLQRRKTGHIGLAKQLMVLQYQGRGGAYRRRQFTVEVHSAYALQEQRTALETLGALHIAGEDNGVKGLLR